MSGTKALMIHLQILLLILMPKYKSWTNRFCAYKQIYRQRKNLQSVNSVIYYSFVLIINYYFRKATVLFEKLRKERDFHKMHHRRVVEEKNRLIKDMKRLVRHNAQYE